MPESRAEFTHRAIVAIGLVTLAALLVAVLVTAADVLLVLFGGILFAVFLRGAADLLSDHSRLRPQLSLTIVSVLLFAVLGVGGWLLAAEVADQLNQLSVNLARLWQQIETQLRRETWGRQLLAIVARAQNEAPAAQMSARITQAVSTTLGALTNFAVIVFIGVYMATNPGWYQRGVLRLVPPPRRRRGRELMSAIGHTLRWWLFGRAVGMVIVGTLTTVGLLLLDMPLALGLGVIAGALDFVPFVGPIIAAVPGVMIAFEGGATQAMYVAALYFGIQLLEGYVITPLIEQRSVRLPPALTISAQVLLGVLIGAVGVVFATPLVAVLAVLIKGLYVEDTLEHPGAKKQALAAREK
jgi:predicted PurR-regulated permease PerM